MGISPKTYKSGGGFLDGKTVTLLGYQFQRRTFDSSDGPFTPQNIELTFRFDGADADSKTWLRMGKAEAWGDQSPDGLRLFTPNGQVLNANSQLGILINSFIPAGAPADSFDADESPDYLSLESFVSKRPRFTVATPVNEEKTAFAGKQKSKKTGKEYDRRDLVVTKFLGFTANGNGATQAASGAPKSASAGVSREGAVKIVQAVLKASGGTLPKGKLPTKVTAQVGTKDPNLEAYRKLIVSTAFLESLDGEQDEVVYDSDSQMLQSV